MYNDILTWYFENNNQDFDKLASTHPKHSREIWDMLLLEAIKSFNQGLEDFIEPEGRRAALPQSIRVYAYGGEYYGDKGELINMFSSLEEAISYIEEEVEPGVSYKIMERDEDTLQSEVIAEYKYDETGNLVKIAGRKSAIDIVGSEAFKIIAFLVMAQGTRRPIDIWAQASTIYTRATADLRNQQALFTAQQELEKLSKTQGLDPETAKNIAGLAADLANKASAATAYSGGGQIGVGGLSERGMPTGVTIQGRRSYVSAG